jgi:laminin, gamma 1
LCIKFSLNGCTECKCDPDGSLESQCDYLGRCKCKPNIAGDKCNKCERNYQNFTSGCLNCPQCYDLVENRYHNISTQLNSLKLSLDNFNQETLTQEFKDENKKLGDFLLNLKQNIANTHQNLYEKSKFLEIKH